MENIIKNMKKAELHLHLDGSLRVSTVRELAIKDGIELPTQDEKELEKYLKADPDNQSLVEYLKKFELPGKVMQTSENLERVAFELVEDLYRENYVYVEIRFAPQFHTQNGLSLEEVVESVLRGMKKAEEKYNVVARLILCMMRHLPADRGYEVVDLVEKYNDQGVVAIDLAGDEKNYSVMLFKEVFEKAKEKGLNITIHAGEADGSESVKNAILCGAQRIGHGVRSIEDQEVIDLAKEKNVMFEVCPVSNYQTRIYEDFSKYPIFEINKMGIQVGLSTDNRTVSNTNIEKEVKLLDKYLEFEIEDIRRVIENNIKGAFIGEDQKKVLLERLRD